MPARKQGNSWHYSFTLPGRDRQRRGGFRTKAEALRAEFLHRESMTQPVQRWTMQTAYEEYMTSTAMKDRSRDSYTFLWGRVRPWLAEHFVDEVSTGLLDDLKRRLPAHLGPKSVNQYLILVRAILSFAWKREKLKHVPFIPMATVPKAHRDWYTKAERDRLLHGMFTLRPQWYLFFYLTARLGLRVAEVYALSRPQLRLKHDPPQLIVDQAVQRGTKIREPMLVGRKNSEAFVLDLTQDIVDAIRWHIDMGFAGERFLFSKDGRFPRYIDSHVGPLEFVQRAMGLRKLSHHAVGRHSVASQAATDGESIKAIQAQLGHRSENSTHRYAHLGAGAQLRLVQSLTPREPAHQERGKMPGQRQDNEQKKALSAATLSA